MCNRGGAEEGATLFTFGLGRRSGDIVSGIGVSWICAVSIMQPKRQITRILTTVLMESYFS